MYYRIVKLALCVVRFAARRACKNPNPGAWQHLVKDAMGDLRWNERPTVNLPICPGLGCPDAGVCGGVGPCTQLDEMPF